MELQAVIDTETCSKSQDLQHFVLGLQCNRDQTVFRLSVSNTGLLDTEEISVQLGTLFGIDPGYNMIAPAVAETQRLSAFPY